MVLYLLAGLIVAHAVSWSIDDEFDPTRDEDVTVRAALYLLCVALWPMVLFLFLIDASRLLIKRLRGD